MLTRAFFFLALVALLSASWEGVVEVSSVTKTADGRPRMMFGKFGKLDDLSAEKAIAFFLNDEEVARLWKLEGDEQFVFRREQHYKGIHTYRFDQQLNGLSVFGGEIAIHVYDCGMVHGLSGNVILRSQVPLVCETKEFDMPKLETFGHNKWKQESEPELMYVVDSEDQGKLVHKVRVVSDKENHFAGDNVEIPTKFLEPFDLYIDALTNELLMDIPVWRKALRRYVYDEKNTTNLPGQLVRSEGDGPNADDTVNQAYDNAGHCYYYYLDNFDRDSWDGQGAYMNSSVHYSKDYNNAFWNGEQMVYGDGDGVIFTDFANDLAVICHELSHAVTQTTSNLRYLNEPGALNEAFSDIMGSSAVVYTENPNNNLLDPSEAWNIGANVTLINLNPDGCPDCPRGTRFMNNPALDGNSRDYYPARYTGFGDNGGVHTNSGIANLAYVLTIQGGVHPQQSTSNFVQPIGITKSEQIYYAAFTQYLVTTSKFADARDATVQVASLFYGQRETDAVGGAWDAVGVVRA